MNFPPALLRDLVDPPLLQPTHLLLESLDLLPAVQRPAIILDQTPHNLATGLLDRVRQLLDLLALLEAGTQRLDLLGHGITVVLRLRGLVFGVGDFGGLFSGGLERLVFFGLQLLEFCGDAGLYG